MVALEIFQKIEIAITRSQIVQMSSSFAHMASSFVCLLYLPKPPILIAIWPCYRIAKISILIILSHFLPFWPVFKMAKWPSILVFLVYIKGAEKN